MKEKIVTLVVACFALALFELKADSTNCVWASYDTVWGPSSYLACPGQSEPAINEDGTYLAWTEHSEFVNTNSYAIKAKDLKTNIQLTVSDDGRHPAISSNKVVWVDSTNQVWAQSLKEGKRTLVTRKGSAPAISGEYVIWLNDQYQILGKNLSDNAESLIYGGENGAAFKPAISSQTVVFECQSADRDACIYGVKLGQNKAFLIQDPLAFSPAISGEIVIWEQIINGAFRIRGINLATGQYYFISNWGMSPAICGKMAVWKDYRQTFGGIYGKDLISGWEFNFTPDNGMGLSEPIVGGDKVGWVNNGIGFEGAHYNSPEIILAVIPPQVPEQPKISIRPLRNINDQPTGKFDILIPEPANLALRPVLEATTNLVNPIWRESSHWFNVEVLPGSAGTLRGFSLSGYSSLGEEIPTGAFFRVRWMNK